MLTKSSNKIGLKVACCHVSPYHICNLPSKSPVARCLWRKDEAPNVPHLNAVFFSTLNNIRSFEKDLFYWNARDHNLLTYIAVLQKRLLNFVHMLKLPIKTVHKVKLTKLCDKRRLNDNFFTIF